MDSTSVELDIEALESRFELQAIDPVTLISSVSPMSSSAKGSCTITTN